MDNILEVIMIALLDIAMFTEVIKLARSVSAENAKSRFVHVSFAIGFLFGVIAKYLSGGEYAVMILYALGFMLSYTAFVFGFPKREEI